MIGGGQLPRPTWFIGCGNMGQAILDGWAVAESPFNRFAIPGEARGRDRETVARVQRLAANRGCDGAMRMSGTRVCPVLPV